MVIWAYQHDKPTSYVIGDTISEYDMRHRRLAAPLIAWEFLVIGTNDSPRG